MLASPVIYNGNAVSGPHPEGASPFQAVLLEVWREACQHIEIGQSTENIARILARHMPISHVLVRRVDPKRSLVETVAAGLTSSDGRVPEARTECSAAQLGELVAWCDQGQVAQSRAGEPRPAALELAIPKGVGGDVLLGPLGDSGGLHGVLVLVAAAGQTFSSQHVTMVEMLLESFSAALENDRRVREMAAMRAAAEADKRSLLSKLGRKEVGDTVVGAQSGLRAVMERVELVARSDVPVLILGETGTGKELIARMIHASSPRSPGPFMRVNCGAIPSELIDSQLFGHERGAFTGAVEARQGWFERADAGTLLLDEIGELPLAAQVRLLRILQDGWLERVGGHQSIHVDVRIVAATHRDLAAMVADGRFREDLWYRIAVFPIGLPPLRERIEDIPALAKHLAEKAAARFVLPVVLPTPEDVSLLAAYPWPGNIRELGAVIDRAAILGDGKRLEVAKALGVSAGRTPAAPGGDKTRPVQPQSADEILSLDEAMKQHIELALRATRGRIEGSRGAAATLKINPHTLRARMRKLKIDWSCYRDADGR